MKPRFALISILQYEMKVSWAKNDDIMRLIQSFRGLESKMDPSFSAFWLSSSNVSSVQWIYSYKHPSVWTIPRFGVENGPLVFLVLESIPRFGKFCMNTEMENFAEKWSIFFEKMQKNVVRSDEVHPKKLQKKVTILHILSSKRVVPTAKFANNTRKDRHLPSKFGYTLTQIYLFQARNECFYCSHTIAMWITRKFEDNVAVPDPRSILFFYLPVSALINFVLWQFEMCSPKFHRSFFSKNACFAHQFFCIILKTFRWKSSLNQLNWNRGSHYLSYNMSQKNFEMKVIGSKKWWHHETNSIFPRFRVENGPLVFRVLALFI